MTETQKLAALKIGKSKEQQDRLDAAACALIMCAAGVPPGDSNYARLMQMQTDGAGYGQEQKALRATGEFVYQPVLDTARDALTRNGEITQRVSGAGNLIAGSMGALSGAAIATAGAATCIETAGITCAAAPLGGYIAAASYEQAKDGNKALFGRYESSEGQRVLDSFNVATYPGERDPLASIGIDAAKLGLAWVAGKYIPKTLSSAEGLDAGPMNSAGKSSNTARSANEAETAKAAINGGMTANEYVNILSPTDRQHILFGDAPGSGGHMYPGQPGKTTYPQSWTENQILHNVGDVVTSPSTQWYAQTGTGGLTTKGGDAARWVAWEARDGVSMRVVYEPATGRIVTAFPDSIPSAIKLKPITK